MRTLAPACLLVRVAASFAPGTCVRLRLLDVWSRRRPLHLLPPQHLDLLLPLHRTNTKGCLYTVSCMRRPSEQRASSSGEGGRAEGTGGSIMCRRQDKRTGVALAVGHIICAIILCATSAPGGPGSAAISPFELGGGPIGRGSGVAPRMWTRTVSAGGYTQSVPLLGVANSKCSRPCVRHVT
jgi:hypothetical protein